jgi:hypothetical protein
LPPCTGFGGSGGQLASRAAKSVPAALRGRGETAGGVDANASKKHLYEVAKRLDIGGRSSMSKDELVTAIGRANDRASARARER